MHDDVNKERYQSHALACIYLRICVVRTIRQSTGEVTVAVTVLAYWDISFARWRQSLRFDDEGCKPTTLDLTQTQRCAYIRTQRRHYCSNRKALHVAFRRASEHQRQTLRSQRGRLWQVAGEGGRR